MRKWMLVYSANEDVYGEVFDDEQTANEVAEVAREGGGLVDSGVIVHVAQVEYGEPVEERREHEIVRVAREYVRLALVHGWSEPCSVEERRCWDALVKSVEGK